MSSTSAVRAAFADSKTVVVKVGTSVVSRPDGTVAIGRIASVVEQIAQLRLQGMRVVLVARTREKLEQTQCIIEKAGGEAHLSATARRICPPGRETAHLRALLEIVPRKNIAFRAFGSYKCGWWHETRWKKERSQ